MEKSFLNQVGSFLRPGWKLYLRGKRINMDKLMTAHGMLEAEYYDLIHEAEKKGISPSPEMMFFFEIDRARRRITILEDQTITNGVDQINQLGDYL